MKEFLHRRPRRNRKNDAIRSMVRETQIAPQNLIAPLFVIEGQGKQERIDSLPGVYRYSIDTLLAEIAELVQLGIKSIMLFPKIDSTLKDESGSYSLNPNQILYTAVREIKQTFPEICVITDVALDPYTAHGHDGIVNANYDVDNDLTVEMLCKLSIEQARAGVDIVAPSDMMDGRIGAIRKALDDHGFTHVSIMSYAVKYASALYAPFRDALGSAPRFGDKKTYQMDPANIREALIEAQLDEQEGADFLLIKPASIYNDVIYQIRQKSNLPIVGYHVSGEYALIQAAHEKGWIDGDKVLHETLLSIKRAGANLIVTYGAKRIAGLLKS